MEQVVKMVAEKAGISESQAKTAVNTVASFLKDKMPAGMASQVDAYLSGSGDSSSGIGGMADKVGGMFGKK
ncbi:DUF2267 domain-containing protein [Antarcticibacterium flavum]|uniref:DUF2267 domain-containing protein n=1 Tax=Antarcticibacterium flavum TaxID=2058175 RepID=A0A5B7X3I4_9FLAO|nr:MULTISPECIES: DUF2267 domain-containing protein [Antarcticibacterium]MCM4161029.1 hypothetical protein [Antarcticibacterium sp. W02-3]QCY69251.1 DUF2267 domain-containing protein [Antarcticibacterium flavum]